MVARISPDELNPTPRELVPRDGAPTTIAGWKALGQSLLTDQPCVFRRNIEISYRYAWIYKVLPSCFKWAGMAALASHHVRLALYPFRLDTDRTGYADIARSLGRRRALHLQDVDTIRMTNNGIFDDIFWVHLAYASADDGIECLRGVLADDDAYAPILAGFETIDRGRRVLEDDAASVDDRRAADDLIWEGNVQLLEHEQRVLVQPHFDHLSCAFARLLSAGSVTSFEVRGFRHEAMYFTSFYLSSLKRGSPHLRRYHAWPRMTQFDDRWFWIVTSVVPRFRRFDANMQLVDASLRRIFDDALAFSANACVIPPTTQHEA